MKERFRNTLLSLFLFMSINSFGQKSPIDITFKREGEGKARVTCTNKGMLHLLFISLLIIQILLTQMFHFLL
jgi:hypothetical protein